MIMMVIKTVMKTKKNNVLKINTSAHLVYNSVVAIVATFFFHFHHSLSLSHNLSLLLRSHAVDVLRFDFYLPFSCFMNHELCANKGNKERTTTNGHSVAGCIILRNHQIIF